MPLISRRATLLTSLGLLGLHAANGAVLESRSYHFTKEPISVKDCTEVTKDIVARVHDKRANDFPAWYVPVGEGVKLTHPQWYQNATTEVARALAEEVEEEALRRVQAGGKRECDGKDKVRDITIDGTIVVETVPHKYIKVTTGTGKGTEQKCFYARFNLIDVDETQVPEGSWAHRCQVIEGIQAVNEINGYQCVCPPNAISDRDGLCKGHSSTEICCPSFDEEGFDECRETFGDCVNACERACTPEQICVLQNDKPRCLTKLGLRLRHPKAPSRPAEEALLEGGDPPATWVKYATITTSKGEPLPASVHSEYMASIEVDVPRQLQQKAMFTPPEIEDCEPGADPQVNTLRPEFTLVVQEPKMEQYPVQKMRVEVFPYPVLAIEGTRDLTAKDDQEFDVFKGVVLQKRLRCDGAPKVVCTDANAKLFELQLQKLDEATGEWKPHATSGNMLKLPEGEYQATISYTYHYNLDEATNSTLFGDGKHPYTQDVVRKVNVQRHYTGPEENVDLHV